MNDLQNIPAVDSLLKTGTAQNLSALYGRELLLQALRGTLENLRAAVQSGKDISIPNTEKILADTERTLQHWLEPTLKPVINATGIILHTNLGRAPLSAETLQAMQAAAAAYSNLEFDLAAGKRGKRSVHAEELLQRLTGAESALVVNNNAAAVMLVLSALARGKRVIIAHSQLVEIGGGFRVPDVMRQSGAKLVAVGTTNRVHTADYERALQEESAALVLTAHHSNFKIIGFTTEPELSEIAAVTHSAGLPLVNDLGSGALLDTAVFGLKHEPTVQEALAAGADVICFSGDKLLGGPQAGIIIGRADLLDKIKRHPLARAVRADKLCLAGISATLIHYLKGEATAKVPVWKMISIDSAAIRQRAESWRQNLNYGEVIAGKSMVGGGSLPEESLPTWLLALPVKKANQFLSKLRSLPQPIIARIEDEQVVFDPRTVFPAQDPLVIQSLRKLLP
ncbi:L-seryl-tRNA(Sec) selenium transferase [Pelolinea submarina]|uniref:L-seryl-tRNA(Sec) selenium transferase n=1 Tax=Pelolinea submarina TaxID=913107 RepID=A0A347ZUM4_9CHLR|nr:L-seryl-tRNA(Sec) selenium transferase [Pelolinea submarina]REG10408.1 L-seryl-tRNA(Sec) selenium transferase [Pelolinea submarina]BBB49005.1 L-seryl-tRNA(Ser) seleniumtransferase [Pelolinea submarina]